MKPFAYQAPSSAVDAVHSVDTDPAAVFLGGGTNLVDHLKLGVAEPRTASAAATASRSPCSPARWCRRCGTSPVRRPDMTALSDTGLLVPQAIGRKPGTS